MLDQFQHSYISNSIEETKSWAHTFADFLYPGLTLGFQGNLGAGKTFIIQQLCKKLGYPGPIQSPTYTLVNEYPGPQLIYHLDFYRLDAHRNWEDLGMEHYLGNQEAIALVEWPDKSPYVLPYIHGYIEISHLGPESRAIKFTTGKRPWPR